jgi:hypothetical protein
LQTRARTLLSIAVIAVATAATVGAWRLRPPPPPPPAASNEPIFAFDARRVRSIDVTGWRGSLRAARVDGAWRVEEVRVRRPPGSGDDGEDDAGRAGPAGGGAGDAAGPAAAAPTPSPEEVDQIVTGLVREIVSLPVIDRFPRDGRPLADFGLAAPQAVVVLGLDDGTSRRLEVGAITVTSAALYARAAPPDEVLQVGTLVFSAIDASLYRLRALASAAPAASPAPVAERPAPAADGEGAADGTADGGPGA